MIFPHPVTPSPPHPIIRSLLPCLLVSLFVFAVYLLTLAPDVLPGDSGELQMAAPLLTIVHPTGYPLYLLLAKLFTFIPIGAIAYRVNLFSAVCGAITIGVFYFVAAQIPNSKFPIPNKSFAAFIAALLLAFTPTFWAQATQAEVYALNSLFVVVLLGLTLIGRHSVTPSPRHPVAPSWSWLALTLGFALTHHRSILLMLPALALYLYPFTGLRRVWRRALLLLVLPLVLYLYTPLRYDATPYTHIKLDDQHLITTLENSSQAFVAHALGAQFGGALQWNEAAQERLMATPQRILGEVGDWVLEIGSWKLEVGGWIAVGLMGLGVFQVVRGRQWRWLTMLAVMLLTFSLFNAAYQIGDIADFYTPVYSVCALFIAHGVWLIADSRWHIARLSSRFLLATCYLLLATCYLLLLILPLILLITNFTSIQQHNADSPRAQWQRLLPDAPRDAILISNDRDEMTPLYYLQLVEGVRPDLIPLFPLISPNLLHVVPLTQYALESSRPVYFVKPMDGLNIKFRLQPQGQLVRVLGVHDMHPPIALARESPTLKLIGRGSRLVGVRPTQIEVVLFWQAQGTERPDIKTYVHVLANGQRIAQSDRLPGGDFYPSSQWVAGEVVRDAHVVTLPATASGEVLLIAGAYLPDGGRVEGLERIELGMVKVGE